MVRKVLGKKSKLRPDLTSSNITFDKSNDFLYGTLISRMPPPKRSWLVEWETDKKRFVVASSLLEQVQCPLNSESNQREILGIDSSLFTNTSEKNKENESDDSESEYVEKDEKVETDEEEKKDASTINNVLNPHGFKWEKVPLNFILQDIRSGIYNIHPATLLHVE